VIKITKRKSGDKLKFELDGKMVNFTFTSVAHGELSRKARKKGAKRKNYYVRTLNEGGNEYSIWVRKRK